MNESNGLVSPFRLHVFHLLDDEKKTITYLFEIHNDDYRLYQKGDVFWYRRAIDETDKEIKSIRCCVKSIIDGHTFYQNPQKENRYFHLTEYYLIESEPEFNFEGYKKLFFNPFDKNSVREFNFEKE